MTYTDFLKKLAETALAYAEDPDGEVVLASAENDLGVSGDVTKDINFDASGTWSFTLKKYCPINVDVTASVQSAPAGSVFSVNVNTNNSQNLNFDNVQPGQEIKATIKTKTFGKTRITVTVRSNQPNTKATFKLHYKV